MAVVARECCLCACASAGIGIDSFIIASTLSQPGVGVCLRPGEVTREKYVCCSAVCYVAHRTHEERKHGPRETKHDKQNRVLLLCARVKRGRGAVVEGGLAVRRLSVASCRCIPLPRAALLHTRTAGMRTRQRGVVGYLVLVIESAPHLL